MRLLPFLKNTLLIGTLTFGTMAGTSAVAAAENLAKPKVVKQITTYSHQADWDATYIDAHEPGYGTGDQHIVVFPFYKTLAALRTDGKPLGTSFRESVLLSSGTVVADKDFWAVNGFSVFKDGRIDVTALYSNTRGGPTPTGTKSYYTITGGTGKYFGARGTIITERVGENTSRYLKSTYKILQ